MEPLVKNETIPPNFGEVEKPVLKWLGGLRPWAGRLFPGPNRSDSTDIFGCQNPDRSQDFSWFSCHVAQALKMIQVTRSSLRFNLGILFLTDPNFLKYDTYLSLSVFCFSAALAATDTVWSANTTWRCAVSASGSTPRTLDSKSWINKTDGRQNQVQVRGDAIGGFLFYLRIIMKRRRK